MKTLISFVLGSMILTGIGQAQQLACPVDSTVSSKDLGTQNFGIFGGNKAITSLRDSFNAASKNVEDDQVVYQDDHTVETQQNIFSLFIRPAAFKNVPDCQQYEKDYFFDKVLPGDKANTDDCRSEVENTSQQWVQSTLAANNPFLGKTNDEGMALLAKCPDPCSYSSYQNYNYSYLPQTSNCQMHVKLKVHCGAPKAANQFLATGTYNRNQVCQTR